YQLVQLFLLRSQRRPALCHFRLQCAVVQLKERLARCDGVPHRDEDRGHHARDEGTHSDVLCAGLDKARHRQIGGKWCWRRLCHWRRRRDRSITDHHSPDGEGHTHDGQQWEQVFPYHTTLLMHSTH